MPDPGPTEAELLELLELLREDRATQEQVDRIEAIVLADAHAMDVYIRYMALTASLRHRLQGLPGLVESAVGFRREEPAGQTPPPSALRFWIAYRWMIGAAAAAIAIAVLLIAINDPSPTDAPPLPAHAAGHAPATLTNIAGDVSIHTADGASGPAALAASLRSGDTLKTTGQGSSAQLTYPDGTRLVLINDCSVTCVGNGRKSVMLHGGVVSAQVVPQPPDSPMLLATPGAKVEVLGTQFAIAAGIDSTALNVSQGRVRLTRVSDGQTVEVAQGQGIVTHGEAKLTVHETGPRDTWDVDFEKQAPKGWVGERVTTQLPPGSRGALQAVRDDKSGQVVYVIATREAWVDGLFAIHDDSHLHITLKMQRPNWLNVFFSTRGGDETHPTWALHNFNEVPYWPPRPGEWRTVTIPLSKFRRKRDGVFHDEPPVTGELTYSLSISATEPDRGLVVDRIWVTRGGPGEVTAKILPQSNE